MGLFSDNLVVCLPLPGCYVGFVARLWLLLLFRVLVHSLYPSWSRVPHFVAVHCPGVWLLIIVVVVVLLCFVVCVLLLSRAFCSFGSAFLIVISLSD